MSFGTKRCTSCASEIPIAAVVCPVCKLSQTRGGRFLDKLTRNIALIIAAASFAVWLIGNVPKMLDVVHPISEVKVITASTKRGTIINTGNRAVYVEDVTFDVVYNIQPDRPDLYDPKKPLREVYASGSVLINQILEPGKMVRYESTASPFLGRGGISVIPRVYLDGFIANTPEPKEISVTEAKLLEAECEYPEVYAKSDPEYKGLVAATIAKDVAEVHVELRYYAMTPNSDVQILPVPSDAFIKNIDSPIGCRDSLRAVERRWPMNTKH